MPAPPLYRQQLKRDLEHWIEKGFVPAESREKILASAGVGGSGMQLSNAIYILGAILIGAGVIAFVADNWDAIPRIGRLGMLLVALWASYGAAIWANARNANALSGSFVLIGVAVFGASIALIGQIYHLSGDAADAMRLWAIGAMLAAILVPSRAALAAATVIGVLWVWQDADQSYFVSRGGVDLLWEYLIFWAIGMAVTLRFDWRPGLHLHLLALIIWLAFSTNDLTRALGWSGNTEILIWPAYSLFWLAIWSVARSVGDIFTKVRTTSHYAVLLAFAAGLFLLYPDPWITGEIAMTNNTFMVLFALALAAFLASLLGSARGRLSWDDAAFVAAASLTVIGSAFLLTVMPSPFLGWLCTGLYLCGTVWLVTYGARQNDRFAINLGFVAFAAAILAVYFRTFSGLLESAIFYLSLGVLLLAGGAVLNTFRRRMIKREEGVAS